MTAALELLVNPGDQSERFSSYAKDLETFEVFAFSLARGGNRSCVLHFHLLEVAPDNLRILVYSVIYDSGYVSLAHPLLSLHPSQRGPANVWKPTLSLSLLRT